MSSTRNGTVAVRLTVTRNSSTTRMTLHPAEMFPFVVSIAVVVQGAVLIGIQSASFGQVTFPDCRTTAQIVWPALWIVPYTMLVFGVETTFRSLQRERFHPRGKWNIPLCIGAIPFLTFLTWTPSNFDKSRGPCLASLIWWTASFAKLGIVIGASLIVTYSLCALIITLQLLRRIKTDRDERIAATRVVYYLIPSVILMVEHPCHKEASQMLTLERRSSCRSTFQLQGIGLPSVRLRLPKLP